MKCSECKYCKKYGQRRYRYNYTRAEYMCEHPEVYKIKNKYGYTINNFIGYGDSTKESQLQLKTSKKWCPLKPIPEEK